MNILVELEFATWINPLSSLAEKKSLHLAACKMKFICVILLLTLKKKLWLHRIYLYSVVTTTNTCLLSPFIVTWSLLFNVIIIATCSQLPHYCLYQWTLMNVTTLLSKSLSPDHCHMIIVNIVYFAIIVNWSLSPSLSRYHCHHHCYFIIVIIIVIWSLSSSSLSPSLSINHCHHHFHMILVIIIGPSLSIDHCHRYCHIIIVTITVFMLVTIIDNWSLHSSSSSYHYRHHCHLTIIIIVIIVTAIANWSLTSLLPHYHCHHHSHLINVTIIVT